jgi:NADH-quinone oxidoreductase subunit L
MGVGLHGPTEAMFHLTTHAFFKALLFLGAGSVILALHHEQDIWKMGGLRKKLPVTFWTFLVGTLALAGVWPFSGFFSKDAILAKALERGAYGHFVLGAAVAGLTAFYMFRLVFVVFYGSGRSQACGHAHESPGVMTWPLRLLAVFSVIGGVIGVEHLYATQFAPEPGHAPSFLGQLFYPFVHAPIPAVVGLLAAALGIAAAYLLYFRAAEDPLPYSLRGVARAMRDKFYFDEIYEATVIRLHDFIAAVAAWIDRWILEGFVIGLARGGTDFAGRAVRLMQTGNLQTYVFLFTLGVVLVLWLALK